MANSLNMVQAIGNLGRDPEMRYMPNGKAVTNFSVAAGRKYRTADGQDVEETEWINCVAYDKLGEICNQYLMKGKQVYVAGRLKTRSWQAEDGQTKYKTEVILNDMQMLGSRADGQREQDREPAAAGGREEFGGPDDLPF